MPVRDLNKMTDEGLQEYYVEVCERLRIKPEDKLLEYLWIDQGAGGRNRVLYARKGTCDILRKIHEISVTDVRVGFTDKLVVATAYGEILGTGESKFRQETAIGSAIIENLTGKALTDAVMTAQTRASRRLTLTFVGDGLLDESELQNGTITTDIADCIKPIVAPIPLIEPSSAPAQVVTATCNYDVITIDLTNSPVQTRQLEELEPLPSINPYQDRVRRYTRDILPRAGMKPSLGIGGAPEKVKALFRIKFPNQVQSPELWNKLMDAFDKKLKTEGPAGLVALIDKAVVKESNG